MKFLFIILIMIQSAFALEGLKVGDMTPDLKLETTEGVNLDLNKSSKPLVLVFYRGSWCPYCINQLKDIQNDLVSELGDKAELVGISVDQTKVAKKMKKKFGFSFHIVSDSKANSLKAFNIVNKVSDDLVQKYKSSYKIDIEGDSGETHHMIAHPAVYIIKDGKIIFADVNLDYKERTDNKEIIKALK